MPSPRICFSHRSSPLPSFSTDLVLLSLISSPLLLHGISIDCDILGYLSSAGAVIQFVQILRMTGPYALLNSLDKTKDNWKVLVLVTRLLQVFNVWTHVLQSYDFVVMDEEGEQIHGRLDHVHYDKFKDHLQEGAILEMENFVIEEKKKKYYCPVKHRYNILLTENTRVKKSTEIVGFPKQHFDFVEFEDVPKRLHNDAYLTDVVGIFNRLGDIEPAGKGKKRDLILDNKSGNAMRITFWENVFSCIPDDLNDIGRRVILIITSTSVRDFNKDVYLQATFGTKVYINMEIPEVEMLMDSVNKPPVVLQPTKKRSLSIEERKDIATIRLALEESTKGEYVCCCVISKIHGEENWSYNSCEKCKKKVNERSSWCDRCNKKIENPIPRFKMQLEIKDETGSIRVTVFDKEATYLLNKSVDDMIDLAIKT